MTGLTNPATSGDAALAAHFCDPAAELEAAAALGAEPDPEAWRAEVAARLARYRTRRKPRAPRYPSLLLPFDAPESWARPGVHAASSPQAASVPADDEFALQPPASSVASLALDLEQPESGAQPDLEPAPTGKVIEFPRSAAIPIFDASPLADPIFDRPRIVEAPEMVPPPPALGGILIEPAQQEVTERRGIADFLIEPASIARRLAAVSLDGLILVVAMSGFAAIFLRFNPVRGPLPLVAGVTGGLAVALWMAYQLLFLVFTGSTPGLRAARVKLERFDGLPANRRTRRWRVLASFLSGFSAGLGYLWCFLDQDSLCWHDRITRTYIRSARPMVKERVRNSCH